MCEWLSFGEWSDVQLLCGGRSFSAHRAVLASVSTFLRRILLTSSDEAITFIVLPDFDLEAMSLVLYYVYNGEVVLKKNKLRLFLEIVNAMQIYVDSQYLTKIQEDIEDKCFELVKYCETISLPRQIFTLGFNNDNEQNFNIKKCKETQRSLVKYSQSELDFHDNSVRCLNESMLDESRLGNLKSPYEDRQRNTLLRDLYIETYPRNGNVNGLTESVLAISNECYQSPASELLANANSRHLDIGGARVRQPKTASCHSIHSPAVAGDDRMQRTYNCNTTRDPDHYLSRYPTEFQNVMPFYNENIIYSEIAKYGFLNGIKTTPSLHSETKNNDAHDDDRIVIDPTNYRINEKAEHLTNERFLPVKSDSMLRKKIMKSKISTRVIFNQVLESPWNARKPNNYRPFRKKEEHVGFLSTNKKEPKASLNDSNNNIDKASLVSDIVVAEKDQPSVDIVQTPPVIENRECFKCIHCDQVFTSSEALAVHMRRHSTNARYTCGECGKTFSQLRNFKYHMSIHRGTREFAATCTVCGKYFNDRGYLSSHMKIHRNRKEYKCSLCPKSFNQRVAYNMHVRIHTGVKPHVCEECGKAFSRKMLLKQHQRTHSGERPYACPHCDKRFADRSNMTLHLRLHTGVKPFSCPMCPKSFTKKHHLKSHLNFHTGSKPYSCPRCQLAFTQSSNMRTHYKKCTAEPTTSKLVR